MGSLLCKEYYCIFKNDEFGSVCYDNNIKIISVNKNSAIIMIQPKKIFLIHDYCWYIQPVDKNIYI